MDRCTYVVLLVIAIIFFAVGTLLSTLSGGSGNGIYKNTMEELSRKYYTDITPAGWTFSIWGVIYIWQALWLIYAFVNIFRRTETGFVCTDPVLMPAPFFVLFAINMGLNLSWGLLFDREHLEPCVAILFLMYVTLYACLFFSYRAFNQNQDSLRKCDRGADIWLTRILVQNGLSIYATWCTIATNLNLALVLIYRSSFYLSRETAGTVALGVITAQIILFVALDFFVWDRFTRYTITPYVVIVVALIGSIAKNYSEGATNTIFTLVLLAAGGALLIAKIILTVVRHLRNPVSGPNFSDSKEDLKKQVI